MTTPWRCIPCGWATNVAARCWMCGRLREDATDAPRWEGYPPTRRDHGIDRCAHEHVEKDDDGLTRRFYICLDCDQEVYLTEPDEDGQSYWEVNT